MAAGVGKTYRMLQEGHAEAAAGRDVVIGYLEPHKREETTEQAAGLEVVPRRSVPYRDVEVEEMDLPALLARKPELALIDELAHTNPPGLEHGKRYEDIADVLAAGIDVFSTVNVQHLESLNDRVAELTGVSVRETVPDSVLGTADEVVLIDLTPEALIARLRAGKIYPGENIEAALNNFFRIENLAALREVSLRQVAEDVESKRLTLHRVEHVGTREERVVDRGAEGGRRAAAGPGPPARPARSASSAAPGARRSGSAPTSTCSGSSRPGKPLEGEEERQVTALRQLASVLGATLLIEEHDDVVAAVARVVRERGSTYIMVGESLPPKGFARLRTPLPQKLMQATPPGVDVRIVAHRGHKEGRVVIEHFLVGLALLLGLLRRLPDRQLALARQALRAARRRAPDPPALHRHRDLAPRARRGAAPGASRGRDADARLPGSGPEAAAAGVRDSRRGGEGDADAGGDRAARRRPGGAGRLADRARPLLPPRACRGCWRARTSTGSSSRPPRPAQAGFSGDDLVWLLEKAPAEVLILRPGPEDRRVVSA